jgi:flagellar biosynthesis protein FliR
MHVELTLSSTTLLAFGLVLTRMTGIFVFIPMPVQDAGPVQARLVLGLAATLALFPRWPSLDSGAITLGVTLTWLFYEAVLGVAIGLIVSFIAESLTLGAQVLALQAGYGYASVVDPTTQADSDVLKVLAQLTAGLLFFTTGLHRQILSAFATTLETCPPGKVVLPRDLDQTVIHLGSSIFIVGLRLSCPVVAMLLLTEVALSLVSRVSPQLQIGSNSYPIKMLLTLATLASVLVIAPNLYEALAREALHTIQTQFTR